MELRGLQMTSAAMPAFHARPIDVAAAAFICGSTDGIYSFLSLVLNGTLKTFAISLSFMSVCAIAVKVLLHITGKTMSADVTEATVPFENQTNKSTMNEATGVALMMLITGENSERRIGEAQVRLPSSMPSAEPKTKPATILNTEKTAAL